jgi:transposase-like protein
MSEYLRCPSCDSEAIVPHRKKGRMVTASLHCRMYDCKNCKHRFIVVTYVAKGRVAEKLEELYAGRSV